jgi:hypothetical protein
MSFVMKFAGYNRAIKDKVNFFEKAKTRAD